MKKITVAQLRNLENQVSQGEITYSRMVEILNETLEKNLRTDLILQQSRLVKLNLKQVIKSIDDASSEFEKLVRVEAGYNRKIPGAGSTKMHLKSLGSLAQHTSNRIESVMHQLLLKNNV